MRYLLQAIVALGALALAPFMIDLPEALEWRIGAAVVALLLVGLAYRGIVGYVNSRRPRRYLDSVMAPRKQPKKKDL